MWRVLAIYHAGPEAVVKEGLFKERLTALVAYMKDFSITVQFCIAHLIRDIKFLSGLKDADTRAYGKKLPAAVKAMFKIIHERENRVPNVFDQAMEDARENIMQGRSAFEFILAAVRAHFRGEPAPSLLPALG